MSHSAHKKGEKLRNKAGSSSVSNVQHKICFSCSPRVLLTLLGSPQKRDPHANSALPNPGPFCQAVCQGNQPVTGGFWCSETPPGHQSGIQPEPHSPGAHVSPAGIYGAQPRLGEASQGTGWGGDSWLRGWKSQPGTSCLLQEHVCTIFWRSQLLKRGK